jgi:hypothetical protein
MLPEKPPLSATSRSPTAKPTQYLLEEYLAS